MAVEDIYEWILNRRTRHMVINAASGLIARGAALLDHLGNPVDRTHPLPVEQLSQAEYTGGIFIDGGGSSQLAVNATVSGATTEVHNGGDNVYWTGVDNTGGSVDFANTEQGFGVSAQSIKCTAMAVGTSFDLVAPAPSDLTSRTSLELKVWVVGGYAGDVITIQAVQGGVLIGVSIDLADYIEESQTGMWQTALVPTSVMGLAGATIDALRLTQVSKVATSPTLHLDNIKFWESGGPVIFVVAAPTGFRIRLKRILITMTGEYTTAVTSNGSTGVSPLGFLGVPTLDSGILIARVKDGAFGVQAVWHDLRDAGKVGSLVDPAVLTDGTTTTIYFPADFGTPFAVEGDPVLNNLQVQLGDNFTTGTPGGLSDYVMSWVGETEPI